MKKFITIFILMVISRIYDIISTYEYIPDLKGEANPLVSFLNFGWTGSLFVQILVLCCLTYALYIYCFKKVNTINIDDKISLIEFVSIFHFNEPGKFHQIFYKLSTNKNSFLYSIGAIVPKALIIISLIVGSSTTMLIYNEHYQTVYGKYNIPTILYLTMIVIVIVVTIDFYKKEKQKRLINTAIQ